MEVVQNFSGGGPDRNVPSLSTDVDQVLVTVRVGLYGRNIGSGSRYRLGCLFESISQSRCKLPRAHEQTLLVEKAIDEPVDPQVSLPLRSLP